MIHNLQIERGLTCGYLGSGRNKYGSRLASHQQNSEAQLDRTRKALEIHSARNSTLPALLKRQFTQLQYDLEDLEFMRHQAKLAALGCGESFEWYGDLIQQMIGVIDTFSRIISSASIALEVNSYENLLYAKELAAKERGLVNGNLSRGKFALGHYTRFIESHALQKYALDIFMSHAPKEHKRIYRSTIDQNVYHALSTMRQHIRERGAMVDVEIGVDAEHWFELSSDHLDQMYRVESELLDHVIEQALQARLQARNLLITYTLLMLFSLLATLWVGYRLFKGVADQRRLTDELHNKNRLLLDAEKVGHFGSWELDLVENQLYWSDEAYRIFGVEPQQFQATYETFLERVHPDDREKVDRAYTQSLHSGKQYGVEHRVIPLDGGDERLVREMCEHVRDVDGNVVRSIGVVRDITEQKRLRELQHQIDVTEEVSRMKDEFLASMSHELRTPLTAIIGFSELLCEHKLDSDDWNMVKAIERASRGQLALVNDILDASKIESGRFAIDEQPYNLSIMLKDIENMFASRAHEVGLDFTVEQGNPEDHLLLGDSQRIRQILINLIGNAVKFTPEGGITLSTSRAGNTLLFKAEDSGVGISPEAQQRLFQRFEQADGSISRRFGGSGLGLYISYNLARMMGGSIDVKSEEGVGSTFTLSLPYQQSKRRERRAESRDEGNAVFEEKSLSGHVLVAEDTQALQLLERRILEKMGLEVTTVNNGQEAVELVAGHHFDLILMDMQMPVMDGIEATRTIRAAENPIPIIALTANVMQKHRDQFNQADCNGFIAKPIDKYELKRVLQRYLPS